MKIIAAQEPFFPGTAASNPLPSPSSRLPNGISILDQPLPRSGSTPFQPPINPFSLDGRWGLSPHPLALSTLSFVPPAGAWPASACPTRPKLATMGRPASKMFGLCVAGLAICAADSAPAYISNSFPCLDGLRKVFFSSGFLTVPLRLVSMPRRLQCSANKSSIAFHLAP